MNGNTHHHGPLAGLGAGAAAVLFAFGVLVLAWHRVAGQVSTGIMVLVYVMITAVCGLVLAALAYVALWLHYRIRNPHLLAGRGQVPPVQDAHVREIPAPEVWTAEVVEAGDVPAIEPPRAGGHEMSDDAWRSLLEDR